jgi:hypothetical protein
MNLPHVTLERADFRGWRAIHMNNGIVQLVAVPDIGGRVMAFNLEDYSFFYVDPSMAGKLFTPQEYSKDGAPHPGKNYGGNRTRPAPQGWDDESQWHDRLDPVLDGGRYHLVVGKAMENAATIEMTSAPEPLTGMRIKRRVSMSSGSSRVRLDLSFTNTSSLPRRWSIADITQLRAERSFGRGAKTAESECAITAPLNPHSRFPGGYRVILGSTDNPQWNIDAERQLLIARYRAEVGKVSVDALGDWVAFHNGAQNTSFVVNYPSFPDGEYPDQGASLEFSTAGRLKATSVNEDDEQRGGYWMEAGVFSPLFTFQPGETCTFGLKWGACRTTGMVVQANEAGCASQPLTVEQTSAGARLIGEFGVYDQGVIEAAWLDESRNYLQGQSLELVTPFQPLILDQTLRPPSGAAFVQLQVVADLDRVTRFLAEVNL